MRRCARLPVPTSSGAPLAIRIARRWTRRWSGHWSFPNGSRRQLATDLATCVSSSERTGDIAIMMMWQPSDDSDTRTQAPPTAPAFLAHNEGDMVAVAVQDVAPGERSVVYLDSDREARMTVTEEIPLGHKVALVDLAADAEVIEYGVRVALA